MSDYQGKRFKASQIPDPVEAGCCPCGAAGSDILSSAAARAAPRDAGDASPSGYACCISPFVI